MQNEQQTKRVTDIEKVREVATILSREYTLEILQETYVHERCTASEIARELGIHVATAMRTLAEMESAGLIARRDRPGTDLDEYSLTSPRFEILLDLRAEAQKVATGAISRAKKMYVREKPNRKVIAEADEEGGRIVRLVFVKGPRWRSAVETLALSEDEGRFLFHIPFGSARAESVGAVCQKAGIREPLQIARIIEFVEEAERMGVLEVVR